MIINDKLHLVVPVYTDDGKSITAYVHSAPISPEAFDAHWELIAKTFSALYAEGLAPLAGPRVASRMLKRVAKQMGDESSALDLLNEIRRLSNVLTRGPNGWEFCPFQEAVDRKTMSQRDSSEVENAIVFFIMASEMHLKHQLQTMLAGAANLWGAEISSLDFMAFSASLGTSTGNAVSMSPQTPGSSVVF